MVHPAHTSNPTDARRGPSALIAGILALASCGSVTLFSEDPSAPKDRASRFDRFVSELDLALTDTSSLIEQVQRGTDRAPTAWDAERRDTVRRAVIESARRRLDREFAPGRLDEARAATSRILIDDLDRLAAARGGASVRRPSPWSGLLVEAPSVLLREHRRSNVADLEQWQAALRTLAVETDFATYRPSDVPSARDVAVAADLGAFLSRLAQATGLGGFPDPLLGPLDLAAGDLNGFRAASLTPKEDPSELGLALQRRYVTAAGEAAIIEVFGATSWEPLVGEARDRWLAPLQLAAGMDASTERLSTIARTQLERLTLELARTAKLIEEGETSVTAARLALRDLRSGERPFPASERLPRRPELLWSEANKRLPEMILGAPQVEVDASSAESFERPRGRWSPLVPGNLAPPGDPRARAPHYLFAPEDADFMPSWLREAEAWRYGVPGRAVVDAYRRAAVEVPPIVRWRTREAFEEGWGLYAVEAAARSGLLTEIDGGFSRVAQELCAFAAMLADLGIYGEGWSEEQALAYLLEATPLPEAAARQVVIRCFSHPGRAALPAIGLLRFRSLRRGVEAALGGRFDPAAFHAALLEGGPVPMPEIDLRIQSWLRRGAPGSM